MKRIIGNAIIQINDAIKSLQEKFPSKKFTMDGRLVGDIGEVLAEKKYEIELFEKIKKDYDAKTKDGKKVQIKATFKDHLTIKKTSDYYLGLELTVDGGFNEIYNGPGCYIEKELGHRKDYGKRSISVSTKRLNQISKTIPDKERIPRRKPLILL